MAALMVAEMAGGCAALRPKPTPDDACLPVCQEAIGRVDVYEIQGDSCSCYRAADPSSGDPGAFVLVKVR